MRLAFTSVLMLFAAPALAAEPSPVVELFPVVKSLGREGVHGPAAAEAARTIAAQLPPSEILLILREIDDANPLAANLLRSAVESIADRAAREGLPLPAGALEAYASDVRHGPRSRRLAYELVLRDDPTIADRLIPGRLHDSNAEFRREAVAHWIAEAKRREAAGETQQARAAYEDALSGALDEDQVKVIVKALREHGVEVDLRRHFGFVTHWKIIGPFDNRGGTGFEAVYPPEHHVDFDAAYEGQLGRVEWKPITAEGDDGIVDIARQLKNYKGSVMYLAAEWDSPAEQSVELRFGTQNAWALWLNGEKLFSREEYHRGLLFDQHRVPATVRRGRNLILLKLLQNEQDEDWAQSYMVQFRITDATGQAIVSSESR